MAKFNHWVSRVNVLESEFPEFLKVIPGQEQWNVRCDPNAKIFPRIGDDLIGAGLPTQPNRVEAGTKERKALWLGPDEWLVMSEDALQERVSKLLEMEGHFAITDISANRVILSLSGKFAREILAKSCDFDFHPNVFSKGCCAQTMLAKAQVIVECPDTNIYYIYVRNSFARYVSEWLIDASREFT